MPSPELAAVNDLLRALRNGPVRSGGWPERRAAMEAAVAAFPAPPGIVFTPVTAHGVPCEWTHRANAAKDRVLIYLHGGGYCIGSVKSHRALVAGIAALFKGRALSVDYRLAPEHRCPAAIEDAVNVYRFVLESGVKPHNIALAGDSAGGGLAIAALVAIRNAGLPMPACGWGLSAWVDLTGHAETMRTKVESDLMVGPESLAEYAAAYAPEAGTSDPRASPVFADHKRLPPLLLQVGTAEVLLDDSAEMARSASAADVEVHYQAWPGMPHVWHAFAAMLPEARQAIEAGAAFLNAKTGG